MIRFRIMIYYRMLKLFCQRGKSHLRQRFRSRQLRRRGSCRWTQSAAHCVRRAKHRKTGVLWCVHR